MKDRLIELISGLPFSAEYEKYNSLEFAEHLADHLLANGIIVPPCKVGDVIYFLLEDDFPVHKWFLSEEKITEVASKGFFTSSFTEPCSGEDFGNYTAYTEIGIEVFLTKEEAEAELEKRDKENA